MDASARNLGFMLADVSRLMRRAFQQRIRERDLTLAQARALVYVQRNEGARQIDLAEILEVQPITLTRLIDYLAERGLVERRPDPDDRRAYRVFLTPAAAPYLAAIEEVAAKVRADALRGVDKQQTAAMLRGLARMRDNLSSR
jgi:DNA-binding MarR family transcriptional regulator